MNAAGRLFKDKTYTQDFLKALGITAVVLSSLLYFPLSKIRYYNGDNETFSEFLLKRANEDPRSNAKSYVQAYADPEKNLIRYSLSSNPDKFRAITTPDLMRCGYKFRNAKIAYAFEENGNKPSILTQRTASRVDLERYLIESLCPKAVNRWKPPKKVRIIKLPNNNNNIGALNE